MILELTEDNPPMTTDEGGMVASYRAELDQYFSLMREFRHMPIYEVLQNIAAASARLAEIRTQIMRKDSRKLTSFRTKELDPAMSQLELQFKIFSRAQAVVEMEYKLSGGGF